MKVSASIDCPHCGSRARVRSSVPVTPTYRRLYLECRDMFCGHTFGADLTVTHTISPSARPNPDIHLRMGEPRPRRGDPLPTPANDPGRRGPEVPLRPAADEPIVAATAVG